MTIDESKYIVWVLVNYFSDDELLNFIDNEIAKQVDVQPRLVVVNNGSKNPDAFRNEIQKRKNSTFIQPNENLGYLGAASKVYDMLEEKPTVFILSNFDLKLGNPKFLIQLIQTANRENFSVIGPSIIEPQSGKELNPLYEERLTKSHINRILFFTSNYLLYTVYQLLHKLKRKTNKKDLAIKSTNVVYAPHGSFLLFQASFFMQGGTLKYASFLYGEEIFIAEQVRNLGLKAGIDFHVTCEHHEHQTTGKFKSPTHMRFLHDSLKLLKQSFFA